jgi:hypothetical protein
MVFGSNIFILIEVGAIVVENESMDRITTLQLFESGYNALHHIMRSHHPRLMDGYSSEEIPVQMHKETVAEYIARWAEFLIFQHEKGTAWAPLRAVECIINNLPPPSNSWVYSQFQMECFGFSNDKSILPPRFTMGQITKTVEHLLQTNPHQQFADHNPNHTSNNSDNTVRFSGAPKNFFNSSIPHSDPNAPTDVTWCEFCKDTRHKTVDCFKAIAAAHMFAKKPDLAQSILKKHAKPQTPPQQSRRNTIHRLVFDDDSPDFDEDEDIAPKNHLST